MKFMLEKAAAYGYNSHLGCPVTEGLRPLFLEAFESDSNGFMYKTRLTGKFCVPIIASDCNGKGDKPWAESKSTQNTKRELKLS